MLSDTIRTAAEHNEFDLETWAHEARKLEEGFAEQSRQRTEALGKLEDAQDEIAELRGVVLGMVEYFEADYDQPPFYEAGRRLVTEEVVDA